MDPNSTLAKYLRAAVIIGCVLFFAGLIMMFIGEPPNEWKVKL